MRARLAALLLASTAVVCAVPARAATACADGRGAILGHAGPATAAGAARVMIVPDGALARAYIGELRLMLAARRSAPDALALVLHRGTAVTDAQSAMQSMHTPRVAPDGRFRCGGLAPGPYLAIVLFSAAARDAAAPLDPAALQIFVASAAVGTRTDAAITGWTDLGGSR